MGSKREEWEYEEMDCVEVANSQVIMCQGNTLYNQYMYLLGDLFREGIGMLYVDSNMSLVQPLQDQEPLPNLKLC